MYKDKVPVLIGCIPLQFRYTATQRTIESARHFTVGLFGRRVSRQVWFPEAIYRDPILRVNSSGVYLCFSLFFNLIILCNHMPVSKMHWGVV